MKPQRMLWNILSVLMIVALAFGWNTPTPVVAQSSGPTERPEFIPENISTEIYANPIDRLSQQSGIVDVVVELEGEPTAVTFAKVSETMSLESANELAANRLKALEAAQRNLLAQMDKAGIGQKVLFQTQRVFNGIYMKVDAKKVREIARMPGVKAVLPLIPKELDNNYSVPLIGAPQVWESYMVNGKGVKVGIIDTGIDYLHTDFGGPGTGYSTNDFTVDEPGFADGYPSAKVVGGWDFAGDAYDANNPASVPQPDPDPMDCNGHGSHVAGTVAGFGTNTNGTTYTGGYSTTTPFTTAMDIGPGVAPLAKLYALRVFGCSGSTNLTDAAIEWATDPNKDGKFDDRLDVINMSLGSSYGSEFDTSAIASNNAALVGVIVVASAGNSSDTHYITGAPGAATRVISVASSQDAGNINTTSQFRVNGGSQAGLKPAVEAAFGADLAVTGDITADLAYDSTNAFGCNAFTSGTFTGKVALISRGTCTFVTKVKNAQNAGAIAVIVFNNVAGQQPFVMGGSDSSITIPAIMTDQATGNALVTALGSETVNVTLSAQWRYSLRTDPGPTASLIDQPSSFTSRGPRRVDSFLKPDIAAPGDTIYSVAVRTGKYGTSMSGTSMAAPHMTGVMALMRQWKPTWTVEELKANVMNTANYDITPGTTKYAPQRVGAGRVNVPAALTNEVVLYNAQDAGAVSVSFGAPQVTALTSWTKTVRVVNKGGTAMTYTPSIVQRTQVPGVTFELLDSSDAPLTSLTVPAGGSVEFKLKMTADPAGMTHSRDATMSAAQTIARFWMAEASGLIVLTPASGTALRLPYYAAPRPASTLHATSSYLTFDGTGTGQVTLSGNPIITTGITPPPVGEISFTTAYELLDTSPNEDMGTKIPALESILDAADLKYIGAMTDAHLSTGGVTNSSAYMYFAIATHGQWSSLNEVEFDIYIDVNQDGTEDYVLFNWNYGRATGGSNPTDEFVTILLNLTTGLYSIETYVNGISPASYNTVAYNNSVVVLPVRTSRFLTSTDSEFDFYVATFARDSEDVVDISNLMTYDAARPALDTTGGYRGLPVWLPNNVIPVKVNFSTGHEIGNLLLLYHHNAENALVKRAEVIAVPDHSHYIPLIMK